MTPANIARLFGVPPHLIGVATQASPPVDPAPMVVPAASEGTGVLSAPVPTDQRGKR